MFDEHICNLELTIRNYQASIKDDNLELMDDIGINIDNIVLYTCHIILFCRKNINYLLHYSYTLIRII